MQFSDLGCTTIYVSLQFQTRTKLWEYLANLCIKIKDSWLLVGDFNEITKPSEVRGGNFSLLRANQFLDIMDKFAFLDLGVVGNPFTWCRRKKGTSLAKRLDRHAWRMKFLEACAENIYRVLLRPFLSRPY